jgi:hypothetical protein
MSFHDFLREFVEHQGAHAHAPSPYGPLTADLFQYAEVLSALGIVDVRDSAVTCRSEDARRFLDSILRSLNASHLPLGDFRITGPELPWVRALCAMERDRPTNDHLRVQRVDQLLIVGVYGDQRYLLMEVDPTASEGWSVLKLPSVRAEFEDASFFDDVERLLGPSGRTAGFQKVVEDVEVVQLSRSHGSLTRYRVRVNSLSATSPDLPFTYPPGAKRIGWMDTEDLRWALQYRREQLFPKIFELKAVMEEIEKPTLTYKLEPRDLAGRRLQREQREDWSVR